MGKGRAASVQCCFCGRNVPIDKATKVKRSSFSFYDERMGIKHRGSIIYDNACVKCTRRRGVKDSRDRQSVGRKSKKRY